MFKDALIICLQNGKPFLLSKLKTYLLCEQYTVFINLG